MSENYPDKKARALINAFSKFKTEKEIQNFLRDLLTISEIKEAANRFHIATLLWQGGMSYETIAKRAKASTTTVTRVADWLNRGRGGYRLILHRLFPKK